jgi:protocatechuate 3,4-dioxygenase beta subunit
MLALLGASGAALASGGLLFRPRSLAASPLPSCVVRPEQTEGPYFVDERLLRSDIRSDPATGALSAGAPLALTFLLSRVRSGACEPLPGAQIDVWHCDAMGVYSDVSDPHFDSKGHRFLRGYQMTDNAGQATFRTIYPGWYPGRAVHIHFKVRTPAGPGRAAEFTSQVYFDDALTDRVHAAAPYASKRGSRQRNGEDRIFGDGGAQLLLAPQVIGGGYEASFALGMDLG